jgi:hypothetical protein
LSLSFSSPPPIDGRVTPTAAPANVDPEDEQRPPMIRSLSQEEVEKVVKIQALAKGWRLRRRFSPRSALARLPPPPTFAQPPSRGQGAGAEGKEDEGEEVEFEAWVSDDEEESAEVARLRAVEKERSTRKRNHTITRRAGSAWCAWSCLARLCFSRALTSRLVSDARSNCDAARSSTPLIFVLSRCLSRRLAPAPLLSCPCRSAGRRSTKSSASTCDEQSLCHYVLLLSPFTHSEPLKRVVQY